MEVVSVGASYMMEAVGVRRDCKMDLQPPPPTTYTPPHRLTRHPSRPPGCRGGHSSKTTERSCCGGIFWDNTERRWKPAAIYMQVIGPKRRALTPLRVFRGVICLLVLLSTALMMLVCIGFLTAVVMRLFSIHYSRKFTSFFFGIWLALWPFLFEKINKTKVIFSGETVPARERVLLMANHRTEVDWMYLWDLALRKGRLGYIKYILKSSLMKLPVFGWSFRIMEFISVERKWEVDETPHAPNALDL
ncbi:hypothetical protein RJ639_045119 [Escallonia herrerae]|uniref:Phospholipid/glycerol acyltransferase domain-containing protein n=1 Tax=Escallonia herrerae TaxID=1293975 RepID=A0AA89B1N2_9ASTE|nr:hypothetical protein RJ639_045119 [Escallonia herrerae]